MIFSGNKLRIADFMIMPICVHMLKHDALAVQFIKSGGTKMYFVPLILELHHFWEDIQLICKLHTTQF